MMIHCGFRPVSREISDRARFCQGFTLIELLVAVAVSGIVVLAAGRLYVSYIKSYNLQQQITDMNMNAHYTIKRLTDDIMQAGADLPDTITAGYDVIRQASGVYDSLVIMINRYGGYHVFDQDVSTTSKIYLPDASGFLRADSCLKMDASYNVYSYSISSVDTASDPDTIAISGTVSFLTGEKLYAAEKLAYFVRGNNLCLNDEQVRLAEDIDSLSIVFYDKLHNQTTDWQNMLLCRIYVRARTATADNSYTHPAFNDGYRRTSLDMEFRLRNKF